MHACDLQLISVCLKMRAQKTCPCSRKRLVSFPARVLRKLTLWLSRAARKQVQNKLLLNVSSKSDCFKTDLFFVRTRDRVCVQTTQDNQAGTYDHRQNGE